MTSNVDYRYFEEVRQPAIDIMAKYNRTVKEALKEASIKAMEASDNKVHSGLMNTEEMMKEIAYQQHIILKLLEQL